MVKEPPSVDGAACRSISGIESEQLDDYKIRTGTQQKENLQTITSLPLGLRIEHEHKLETLLSHSA